VSSQKHEILFSQFGINYNALPSPFRKGSVLVREKKTFQVADECASQLLDGEPDPPVVLKRVLELPGRQKERQGSTRITLLHCDIIGDEFWEQRPYLLDG
jgi:tRNA(His) guanylyltransferase